MREGAGVRGLAGDAGRSLHAHVHAHVHVHVPPDGPWPCALPTRADLAVPYMYRKNDKNAATRRRVGRAQP